MAGRKYSKEFRQEAVEMTNVPGVTLKQLGEELGVTAALS
ncbi:MAG: transposase [Proteobacteria bacterium]|nr:transposase [Pseudomonadota bacterium]